MTDSPVKLSVVSPVYGAASVLPELVARIKASAARITGDYEIILVEDGSPDDSWEIIQRLSAADNRIIGLSFSRNFGQQYALNAGLEAATGDWIVTLDCDLQDEPERIVDLFNEAMKGYDIVFASRVARQDGPIKRCGSRVFCRIMSYLTETNLDHSIANFVLYSRKAIAALTAMGDYYKYYPVQNHWIGFRTAKLPVQHAGRKDRIRSSYSLKKRLDLAMMTIVTFSDKPLRLVMGFGISLVAINLVIALFLTVRHIVYGEKVSGWLSIFLSIWILSGIIIAILGMMGTYMGKMFETVKNRPRYIVKETTAADRRDEQ
jgi:dolichol-phosphate mannosyltransferase